MKTGEEEVVDLVWCEIRSGFEVWVGDEALLDDVACLVYRYAGKERDNVETDE